MKRPQAEPAWASEIVSAPSGRRPIPTPWSSRSAPPAPLLPAADKPAEAPIQVNEIKPGTQPLSPRPPRKSKKPKTDLSDESSSKKKKKKGLAKINPF